MSHITERPLVQRHLELPLGLDPKLLMAPDRLHLGSCNRTLTLLIRNINKHCFEAQKTKIKCCLPGARPRGELTRRARVGGCSKSAVSRWQHLPGRLWRQASGFEALSREDTRKITVPGCPHESQDGNEGDGRPGETIWPASNGSLRQRNGKAFTFSVWLQL